MLKGGNSLDIKEFNFGVSYRPDEKKLRFRDASNIVNFNDQINKRYGLDFLIKDSGGDSPNLGNTRSLSYFNKNNTEYFLFKAGATLNKIDNSATGFSSLSSAYELSADTRHRAITMFNRHIIAMESDGLFQFTGEVFTRLGNQQPDAASISVGPTSSDLTAGSYQLKYTFYSSVTGYESNPSSATAYLPITAGQSIQAVTAIRAQNQLIDYKRLYVKKSTETVYRFYKEVPLNESTSEIKTDPLSSEAPPDNSDLFPDTGKYLANYGGKLVLSGVDGFESDVYFSNQDDPESQSEDVLNIPGNGPVTGLAVGYEGGNLSIPYLIIFKRNSTHLWIGDEGAERLITLSERIGCVSHDSIIVRNGDVYFVSTTDAYEIKNGRITTKDSKPYPLGGGDLSAIFKEEFEYSLSMEQIHRSFAIHIHSLDLYAVFVPEKNGQFFKKAYCYNFSSDSWLPWEFPVSFIDAQMAENDECLLLQRNPNYDTSNPFNYPSCLFKLSRNNLYRDVFYPESTVSPTKDTTEVAAYGIFTYIDGGDYQCSFNFREFFLRVLREQPDITVKAWVNFTEQNQSSFSLDSANPDATFILGTSRLDVDAPGAGRLPVTIKTDVNLCGENISLGFYQSEIDSNMTIYSAQLKFQKNGNRNK